MKWRLMMIFGLVSLLATTGFAESDTVQFGSTSRLISFESLMRLKPGNRTLYLNELRTLMIEIEAMQEARGIKDPKLRLEGTAHFEFLSLLIETAEAGRGSTTSSGTTTCRAPRVTVRDNRGRLFCTTRQAAGYLDLVRRDAARGWHAPYLPGRSANDLLSSNWKVRVGQPFQSIVVRNPQLAQANGSRTSGGTSTAKQTATAGRTTERPARTSERPAPRTPAATKDSSVKRSSGSRQVARTLDVPPAPAPADPVDVPPLREVEECANRQSAIPASSGLACTRESIDTARRSFRGKTCVYAGHIRPYRTESAMPGQCKPIHQWCVNNDDPENCRVPTDQAQSFTPVFSCQPSQVLCSPLLFGVKVRQDVQGPNRFQAYCVPRGQSATADCYEAMSAGTMSGSHLDLANMHPEGTAGATTLEETLLRNASDEEKERIRAQFSEIPRMWKILAHQLTSMCLSDTVERQVFCEECTYIRQRLSQMAYLTTRDATATCADIKEFVVPGEDPGGGRRIPAQVVSGSSITDEAPLPGSPPPPPRPPPPPPPEAVSSGGAGSS